jgi:hypothetical protein
MRKQTGILLLILALIIEISGIMLCVISYTMFQNWTEGTVVSMTAQTRQSESTSSADVVYCPVVEFFLASGERVTTTASGSLCRPTPDIQIGTHETVLYRYLDSCGCVDIILWTEDWLSFLAPPIGFVGFGGILMVIAFIPWWRPSRNRQQRHSPASTDIPHDLRIHIQTQRQQAIRNRDRLSWATLLAFLGMIPVAILFTFGWMMFWDIVIKVRDIPEPPEALVFGVAVTWGVVVMIIACIRNIRQQARCPQCGCLWIDRGRLFSSIERWSTCPGCGISMIFEEKDVAAGDPGELHE